MMADCPRNIARDIDKQTLAPEPLLKTQRLPHTRGVGRSKNDKGVYVFVCGCHQELRSLKPGLTMPTRLDREATAIWGRPHRGNYPPTTIGLEVRSNMGQSDAAKSGPKPGSNPPPSKDRIRVYDGD
jgi:hypothetical protein